MSDREADPGGVVRILGIDDEDGGRPDRGEEGEKFRYRRSEVPTDEFRRRVENFVAAMRDVIGNLAASAGEYYLDQVQISVEVSAKGQLSLLGTGGELAGKGGMTFTFKKPPPRP